jgi:prepilin-type processing-associated H-X9-DG protein
MPDVNRRFFLIAKEWIAVAGIVVVVLALLLPQVQQAGAGSARRQQCRKNLRQIALALHLYHEKYACFPPAFIANENARPIHSWRVLILPFLDRQDLYDQYRFDEPWDGPHNSTLASEVVKEFTCPSDNSRGATPMTNYVAVVGPGTAWPGEKPAKIDDFADGTANTLLVVEVANSGIHWIEPRDVQFSTMVPAIYSKSGLGISSAHKGGATAVFADGHVWFLSEKLPSETLKAILTRAGGEPAEDL